MTWTEDACQRAAFLAPLGRELFRSDTRVIERPGWYQIVTPSAVGHLNEVYISQVAPEHADRVIEEVMADHASRPGGAKVKWCVGRLDVPSACSVEEVTLEALDEYVAFESRGWSRPADQHELERRTYVTELTKTPRSAHFFAARIDRALVGSSGIFLRDDFGYLVGGLIAAESRGRGLYRGLVSARLAFLRARGISLAITHARDATSAPMLEHLGFRTVYRYECWYAKS